MLPRGRFPLTHRKPPRRAEREYPPNEGKLRDAERRLAQALKHPEPHGSVAEAVSAALRSPSRGRRSVNAECLQPAFDRALAADSGSGSNLVGEQVVESSAHAPAAGFQDAGVLNLDVAASDTMMLGIDPDPSSPGYGNVTTDGAAYVGGANAKYLGFDGGLGLIVQPDGTEASVVPDRSDAVAAVLTESTLTPIYHTTRFIVSRQLDRQHDVGAFVENALLPAAISATVERAVADALAKSADIPELEVAGGNGGYATFANALDLQEKVAGDPASGSFVMGPELRSRLARTTRAANGDRFIVEGRDCLGLPCHVTAALAEGYPVPSGTDVVVYAGGAAVPAGAYLEYTDGGTTYLFENESAGQIDIGSSFVDTGLTERRFRTSAMYFGDLGGAAEVRHWPTERLVTVDPTRLLEHRQLELVVETAFAVRIARPSRIARKPDAASAQVAAYS